VEKKISNDELLVVAKKVSLFEDLETHQYWLFINNIDKINSILIKNKNKPLEKWEHLQEQQQGY
jgi:hypothetical protein